LKAVGDAGDARHMVRARHAILARGGAARAHGLHPILLALFGAVDVAGRAVMPVEIMSLPRWFPFTLDKVSYWFAHRVGRARRHGATNARRNPRGSRSASSSPPAGAGARMDCRTPIARYSIVFATLDRVLRRFAPHFHQRARESTPSRRRSPSSTSGSRRGDGIGAIYPAMAQ